MIGHVNVNFNWNKFEPIADVIQRTFDTFHLSETKIDESFSYKQFCLNNFRIFWKERNQHEGGGGRNHVLCEWDSLVQTFYVQSSK